MATDGGNVTKELHKLLRKADRLYDGQVEFVLDDGGKLTEDNDVENEDGEYLNIFFFVTPKDGPYRGARVKFHMAVNTTYYPGSPPQITCRNSIYHPNINVKEDYDLEADICVNLLDSDWEPEVGLDGAVMAVLFLFYNPELDDALSPLCTGHADFDEFEKAVRCSLRGEDVEGHFFDKLLSDAYDTDANDKFIVLGDCDDGTATTPPTTTESTITKTTETTAASATATITTETAVITTTTEPTEITGITTIAMTTTNTTRIETTNEYSKSPIVIETATNLITPEAVTNTTEDNYGFDNTGPVDTINSNQMTGFKPDMKLHKSLHMGHFIKCWFAKLISMFSSHFEAFRKKS